MTSGNGKGNGKGKVENRTIDALDSQSEFLDQLHVSWKEGREEERVSSSLEEVVLLLFPLSFLSLPSLFSLSLSFLSKSRIKAFASEFCFLSFVLEKPYFVQLFPRTSAPHNAFVSRKLFSKRSNEKPG